MLDAWLRQGADETDACDILRAKGRQMVDPARKAETRRTAGDRAGLLRCQGEFGYRSIL